jgi:type IV secretory pathway TrbL component
MAVYESGSSGFVEISYWIDGYESRDSFAIFTITGQPASILRNRELFLSPGSIVITGMPVVNINIDSNNWAQQGAFFDQDWVEQ